MQEFLYHQWQASNYTKGPLTLLGLLYYLTIFRHFHQRQIAWRQNYWPLLPNTQFRITNKLLDCTKHRVKEQELCTSVVNLAKISCVSNFIMFHLKFGHHITEQDYTSDKKYSEDANNFHWLLAVYDSHKYLFPGVSSNYHLNLFWNANVVLKWGQEDITKWV